MGKLETNLWFLKMWEYKKNNKVFLLVTACSGVPKEAFAFKL